MTARQCIKEQHRLQREEQFRSLERSQTCRHVLGFGAAAIAIAAIAAFAVAFAPWSSSGEAEDSGIGAVRP